MLNYFSQGSDFGERRRWPLHGFTVGSTESLYTRYRIHRRIKVMAKFYYFIRVLTLWPLRLPSPRLDEVKQKFSWAWFTQKSLLSKFSNLPFSQAMYSTFCRLWYSNEITLDMVLIIRQSHSFADKVTSQRLKQTLFSQQTMDIHNTNSKKPQKVLLAYRHYKTNPITG